MTIPQPKTPDCDAAIAAALQELVKIQKEQNQILQRILEQMKVS